MQFINAIIEEIEENIFRMEVFYSWYNLYNYSDVYVFSSLEKAKDKLLEIRTRDRLSIVTLSK